jgi:hypothetical protein
LSLLLLFFVPFTFSTWFPSFFISCFIHYIIHFSTTKH